MAFNAQLMQANPSIILSNILHKYAYCQSLKPHFNFEKLR